MRSPIRRLHAVGLATVTIGGLVLASGSAAAAFPNFSDCPRSNSTVISCVNIQARSGSLNIKGFNVPLGESLEIRGGASYNGSGLVLAPPTSGGNGVIGRPVNVPGGLLGIPLPIPGNQIEATAELAGSSADVRINLGTLMVSLPLKLRLRNALIGSSCYIGSNSDPARLNLTPGTTAPPAPNGPISGRVGTFTEYPTYQTLIGNVHVDNAFSVPGAAGCGLISGILIRPLINAKLRIPSAAGNNTMIINNDIALSAP